MQRRPPEPGALSHAQAACLPLAGVTAWERLAARREVLRAVLAIAKIAGAVGA
ncbi:hypothetical protein [Sorangium cellulosum]|uniref:hypothetical protein n=1 Tax=Sorangium cellulosum TaxID=56 RepID=UPI000A931BE1|nr:hypothetical protein [Sorangium cellulosum]